MTTTVPLDLVLTMPPEHVRAFALIMGEHGGAEFTASYAALAAVLGVGRSRAVELVAEIEAAGWCKRTDQSPGVPPVRRLAKRALYVRVPLQLATFAPPRVLQAWCLLRACCKLRKQTRRAAAQETAKAGRIRHAEIAEMARCARRTIRRALEWLRAAGWMVWQPLYRRHRRIANSYTLRLYRPAEPVRDLSPPPDRQMSQRTPSGEAPKGKVAVPAFGASDQTPDGLGSWLARVRAKAARAAHRQSKPPPAAVANKLPQSARQYDGRASSPT